MATKVMRPQEIPVFQHNRRKNFYGNRNGGRKPEQKSAVRPEPVDSRRSASFDQNKMRPVTILKRGEPIGPATKAGVEVRSDLYAGSTISMSPSPRSLPLPSFFSKKQASEISDDFATRDLRRLLRLD